MKEDDTKLSSILLSFLDESHAHVGLIEVLEVVPKSVRHMPLDSKEMQALVSYMEWISSGIPELGSYPWLGEKKLASDHVPDPKRGEELFAMKCAPCHGKEGEGQKRPLHLDYPPLWGDRAFNDAAGMNKLDTFAYFIYENMPYNEPKLSVEEAIDIASYVTKQPRPKFQK